MGCNWGNWGTVVRPRTVGIDCIAPVSSQIIDDVNRSWNGIGVEPQQNIFIVINILSNDSARIFLNATTQSIVAIVANRSSVDSDFNKAVFRVVVVLGELAGSTANSDNLGFL